MHVSLAEALEVRGGPLQEEEVWAVLSQSAESLQELFHKGIEHVESSLQRRFLEMSVHAQNTFLDTPLSYVPPFIYFFTAFSGNSFFTE